MLPRAFSGGRARPPAIRAKNRVARIRLVSPVAGACARRLRRRRRLGHDDRGPAPSAELHQPRRGRVVHRAQAQRRAVLGSARPVQPVKRRDVVDEQQPATAARDGARPEAASPEATPRPPGRVVSSGGVGVGVSSFSLAARSRSANTLSATASDFKNPASSGTGASGIFPCTPRTPCRAGRIGRRRTKGAGLVVAVRVIPSARVVEAPFPLRRRRVKPRERVMVMARAVLATMMIICIATTRGRARERGVVDGLANLRGQDLDERRVSNLPSRSMSRTDASHPPNATPPRFLGITA